MTPVVTRIGGLAAAVLVVAIGYLAVEYSLRPPAGSYEITVLLGQAGSGMGQGIDVKARGVIIGEVDDVWLEDGRAVARLTIYPDQPLPDESRLTPVVTSKTFLGQKQVELLIDGEITEPFLSPGATLVVPAEMPPREPVDLFEAFAEIIEAIPAPEFGALVEAFGTFTREDAEIAGRNIELSDELFAFQARTADDQLQRFSDLADILVELAPRAADLNRLMETAPEWVSLLPDRQADIRRNLDALSSFSVGFAELLEVNETALSDLLRFGDSVTAVIEPRVHQIGNIVHGAYRYGFNFGHHGGELDDGTEHAWFRVIFPIFEELCYEAPDELEEVLSALIPGCPAPDEGPGQ